MGCSSCGKRAAGTVQYPREAVMPDGSRVEVTSAADERAARERFRAKEREQATAKGYTVRRH